MASVGYLIFGIIIGILIPSYLFCYMYKYLCEGKIRAIANRPGKPYSFKKKPFVAIVVLIGNLILTLVGIITGISMLLIYFGIIK